MTRQDARIVRDDRRAADGRYQELVDVLATTLLARVLSPLVAGAVNQNDGTICPDSDSSLAFPANQSPDGAKERGRGDPARPHGNRGKS